MKKVKIILSIIIILTFLLFVYHLYSNSHFYLMNRLNDYINENKEILKYEDNRVYVKELIEKNYLKEDFVIMGKGKINTDISHFIVGYHGESVIEENIFYKNKKYLNPSDKNLYSAILKDNKIITNGDGLYKKEDKFLFKGSDVNNYIWYNGILYRIISINNDGIKLISEKPITSIYYSDDSNDWENSYVRKWLNKEVFINSVDKNDLFNMNLCTGKTNGIETKKTTVGLVEEKLKKVTNYKKYSECNKINKDYIGLISFSEYMDAKTKNGNYLYQKNNFYTLTPDTSKGIWYSYWGYDSYMLESKNLKRAMAVRPVITLKKDTNLMYGNGTKENYYIVDKIEKAGTLGNKKIGNYFVYSGYLWRIMSKDENKVKAKLATTLDRKTFYIYKGKNKAKSCYGMDFQSEKSYKSCTNIFSENEKNLPLFIKDKYHAGGNNIATYLNNKEDKNSFYNNLENSEWIFSSKWDISYYKKERNSFVKKDYVTLNVGMPKPGEMFSSNDDGIYYYTISPVKSENNELVNYIDFNGELKEGLVTNPFGIRPVINLQDKIKISSGAGLYDDPYYLE